jgi:cytochrome c5
MKKTTLVVDLAESVPVGGLWRKSSPRRPVPWMGPPVVPVIKPKGEATVGQLVFDKTCALCHGAGVSGAPRPGDKAAWAPRIAQGNEVLFKHAPWKAIPVPAATCPHAGATPS